MSDQPVAQPANQPEGQPARRPGARATGPRPGQPGAQAGQAQAPQEPWLQVSSSRNFPGWLGEHRISLAFTTYQTGKVLFIGLKAEGQLSIFERTFARCMGLWSNGQTMWMSSLFQLWRFENGLRPGQQHDGYDTLYIPRVGYTTGDLDVHDIAVDSNGRVIFVNTLFGCLATLSERHSFMPLWRPPFLSKLAGEDRCHLNGIAMDDGRPRYVTAVSTTDVVDGWREHRRDGGVVVDVASSKIVASGLSMPHSPRVYRGKLWVHNSGLGQFGTVDPATGKFEPVAFCPGYLRGLAFCGDYAIVGLSGPRKKEGVPDKTFGGLQLDDELKSHGVEARCGLSVIDLRNGDIAHWVRIEGMVAELYDVAVLPGVRRPSALGFKTDEIRRLISVDEQGTL
jgi:uncharacterized protein (TIGR03032 family)